MRQQANAISATEITRAFMEKTFGPTSESDDKDSRMEKYGVAFAAIDYVLESAKAKALAPSQLTQPEQEKIKI